MERSTSRAFSERTEARLEREQQDAIKGFLAVKTRERILKRQAAECKDRLDRLAEQSNDGEDEKMIDKEISESDKLSEMEEEGEEEEEYTSKPSRVARSKWTLKTDECFEIVDAKPAEEQPSDHLQSDSVLSILAALDMLVPKREKSDKFDFMSQSKPMPYEHTKISALKRARERRRERDREKRLAEEKKRKFLAALSGIKTTMQIAEWNRTCHLRERQIVRERNRLKNIARIRWAYSATGFNLPPDSYVFDKILGFQRERDKQALARQERMKDILRRINREMGSRCIRSIMKKRTILGMDSLSKSTSRHDVTIATEISTRTVRDPDEHIQNLKNILEDVSHDSYEEDAEEGTEEKLETVDQDIPKKSRTSATTRLSGKAEENAAKVKTKKKKKPPKVSEDRTEKPEISTDADDAIDRSKSKSKKKKKRSPAKVSKDPAVTADETTEISTDAEGVTDHSKAKRKKRKKKLPSKVSQDQTAIADESRKPEIPADVDEETENLDDANIVVEASAVKMEEEMPKDTNFYTNPSVVTFEDFKPNKVYTRKVLIVNKRPKWAYLRFQRVETEVWEPIIEIDIDGAAKLQPGLSTSIVVTFSPVSSEMITADICFVTLGADHPERFHELRVPVRCTPEVPKPLVEPRELKFPTAPIWKFNDPKLGDKVLTVSNEGGKSFSFTVSRKEKGRQYFFWTFEDGDIWNTESFDVLDDREDSLHPKSQIKQSLTDDKGETNDRGVQTVMRKIIGLRKLTKDNGIEVPPKVKCHLTISFHPQYVGLHHEVLELSFAVNDTIFEKQDIPMWGETVGLHLHLQPNFVDLGIVVMDSGVYQRNFEVVNTDRMRIEVTAKTPKLLGGQVSVHPKTVSILPESFVSVSIRIVPKSSIVKACKKYYDSISNQLQFPVQIQAISTEFEGAPPLILKVLATLTTSHALLLEPSHVDLGQVYTHEAVLTELSLTNESLVVQDYGFPNLPTFMEVQPNHGFGTILPGETIRLHLIYWPCLTDIPGNDIQANGLAGEQRFRIEADTITEYTEKSSSVKDKTKISSAKQISIANTDAALKNQISDMQQADLQHDVNSMDQLLDNDAHNHTPNNSLVDNNDQQYTPVHTPVTSKRSKREDKSAITVTAYIVDTFCEFSEQFIEFPATPCGSVSTVSVDLRGFNMASDPNCTCGIVKSQTTEFTAHYDFRCSSDQVRVNPRNGLLRGNDLVKVIFVFEPKLPKHALLKRAQELKAERIAEELEKAKLEKPKARPESSRRKGKKKKEVKEEAAVESEEVSEIDALSGEVELMESFEPRIMTIYVTCLINVGLVTGLMRDEILYAKLVCPVVKPEIIIINTRRDIHFGPTAIGTAARKRLLVKNISNRNLKVRVSPLNPFGPFFIPPGKLIEPGTILTLPITFRPTDNDAEHVEEFFEVSAVDTSTVWRLRVTGQGAVPSWSITPQMLVARLVSKPGTTTDFKMSIRNTGECPLTFNLVIIEMLEGDSPLIRPETAKSSDREEKKKKKKKEEEDEKEKKKDREKDKKNKKKNDPLDDGKRPTRSARSRREKFGANLYEDEVVTIYEGGLQPVENRDLFEFVKFDEHMSLTVKENEKVDFVIRFRAPEREQPVKQKKGSAKKDGRVLTGSGNAESKKGWPTYHVGLFRLMLGNVIFVQDIILCLTS